MRKSLLLNFIVLIFTTQISKEIISCAVKKIQNAVKVALKGFGKAASVYKVMTKKSRS